MIFKFNLYYSLHFIGNTRCIRIKNRLWGENGDGRSFCRSFQKYLKNLKKIEMTKNSQENRIISCLKDKVHQLLFEDKYSLERTS